MSETNSNPNPGPVPKATDPAASTLRLGSDALISPELVRLLDDYLNELEAGRQPDRAKLLADHPALASQLEPALAGLDFIHGAKMASSDFPERLGDFRIIREVGRGGMGIVYEAEQISLKRKVALKVLRFATLPDREALQRFQREAETVGALHHTNIVPIYAIGREGELPYYAMQFIEGRSLAEVIQDEAFVSSAPDYCLVADWALQAAEALAHAHQRGVIHRDIKPSNLILDPDGRIWLTDFGLAKRADDLTLSLTGALLGTPRYMSPEQASALHRPVDHRTDLYSLGVTLYELVTHRPIFEVDSPDVIITKILTAEPPSPRQLVPGVPRDLETIILKCLEKEAGRRYAGARELADDLRAFREGRPIQARRPRWPERAARWARKHKRSTVVASISMLATAVLLASGWIGWNKMRHAQLGKLTLTTSGENLVAEILGADNQPIVPAFPVPTPEPVALPAGSYQLRLSSSGLLSESWPLEIKQGGDTALPVQLRHRWLWSPLEINQAQYPEIEFAQLGDATDLVQLSHYYVAEDGRGQRRLRRILGGTGLPAWTSDLIFDQQTLPPGRDLSEWHKLLAPSGLTGNYEASQLVPVQPDLNGDGTGDLVWISRTTPSLLAVSGKDGQPLWWHRSRSAPPGGERLAADDAQPSVGGTVVGRALALEIDEDGVLDFIVCLSSYPGTLRTADGRSVPTPPQGWVEAVSGRMGQTLWRRDLGNPWPDVMNDSRAARRWHGQIRPLLDREGSQARMVLLLGQRLIALNPHTGADAVEPLDLGFEPWQAPRLFRAGTNQDSCVLLMNGPIDSRERLTLSMINLTSRERIWERDFRPLSSSNPSEDPQRDWFYLATMRQEDVPLVIFPARSEGVLNVAYRLEAVRADTGQTVWSRSLPDRADWPPRGLAGPDVDGDGRREFFLVSMVMDFVQRRALLAVTAHSGANGNVLWEQRHPHSGSSSWPDRSGSLAWWQGTADRWPLLVVPVFQGHGHQPVTLFYSALNGRLDHILSDVYQPRLADFDGDGLLDIFHTVSPQSAPRGLTIKGQTPEVWRKLGTWEPAGDVDRDGFTDLMSRKVEVASGRDGRRLYAIELKGSLTGTYGPLAGVKEDLNRDGISDLVFSDLTARPEPFSVSNPQPAMSQPTYSAFSGSDGTRLWSAPYFGMRGGGGSSSMMWEISYPALDAVDLEGDGWKELLVLHGSEKNHPLLTALEGTNGRVRWQVPAVAGTFPSLNGNPPPVWADLNGDAVADPVVWAPVQEQGGESRSVELRAYDGRGGALLWNCRDLVLSDPGHVGWPQAQSLVLAGVEEAQVFVVFHKGYQGHQRGYELQLAAIDGRSGLPRWSFAWTNGFPDFLAPIPVRVNGTNLWMAMGIREEREARLILLDGQGAVRFRKPLPISPSQFYVARSLWRAVDLDGDGQDELMSERGGSLSAWKVDREEPLWSWKLPGSTALVLRVEPGTAQRPSQLAIWSGKSVYGIEGTTGRPVWRGDVPMEPGRNTGSPVVKLLQLGPDQPRPGLLLVWPQVDAYSWFSSARETWPCAANGRFVTSGFFDGDSSYDAR